MPKTRNGSILPARSNAPRPPSATGGKHYLYSWVTRKALPSGRAFVRIRRELSKLRGELIERYGGNKITPEAVILIDSVIEALGVQKLQGLYIRKAGIIRQDSLKAGNLELHSILGKNWISYANVVRQNLLALQDLKLTDEKVPDITSYIAEFDAQKAAKEAQASPERPVVESSKGDEPNPLDKEDNVINAYEHATREKLDEGEKP
jgi:hypothetical protein